MIGECDVYLKDFYLSNSSLCICEPITNMRFNVLSCSHCSQMLTKKILLLCMRETATQIFVLVLKMFKDIWIGKTRVCVLSITIGWIILNVLDSNLT